GRSWPAWASPTRTWTADRGRNPPPALDIGPVSRARLPTWPAPGAPTTAMPEDDSRPSPQDPPDKRRSWLDRISSALSGEPTTREDLVEILRDAQAGGLIQADTLRTMEGAMAVSELTVGDAMIPRSQMVSLPIDAGYDEVLAQVVES